MSVETAHEFLKFFDRDEPVKTQYDVADVDDMRELLTFAGQKGYKISEEDLRACDLKHKMSVWTRYAFKLKWTHYGFIHTSIVNPMP